MLCLLRVSVLLPPPPSFSFLFIPLLITRLPHVTRSLSHLLTTTVIALAASTVSAITPPPLELTEFAREPLVRNGVAITVDEQNRVYVTSVVRRQAADLDIRRFREWIETDLSLTSVKAKETWFRQELTPANSERYANRFEDANQDGSFDWTDLDQLPDQITLFQDHEGDGTADDALKFNATENTTITGIAAGITAWDGAVYATVEPDLVRLTDTTGDGILNHRQVLATGFSLHIGYGGHNFSGPIIGPDGRLYAAVADRGMNVTSLDGQNFYNPHSGALVRCELDGSNFEMFATGLRNVHEPAFDAFGNVIGVDNDGDFSTEKERLVYITEGSDTGWRTNWQYRGKDWLPWMDEGLSIPAHPGQPAYITPPILNYLDGPAGFVFNPGTAFSPAYRDFFFLARFPARDIYAFRAERDGAAIKMVDSHQLHQGILAVGLEFGADGALYLADWASTGYDMNEQGAVWKLDDPTDTASTLRQTTARLLAQDWHQPSRTALRAELGNPDQRIRMKAQFELVRRGATEVLLASSLDRSGPQLSRLHAIWGIGQLLRHGHSVSDDQLLNLLADKDDEVRAQAAKVIGEAKSPSRTLSAGLIPLLRDTDDRPRFFAAIALGRLGITNAQPELIAYLERDGADPFHRHAGVMGLFQTASAIEIEGLAMHPSISVRMGAVLALRRKQSRRVNTFLLDSDPLIVAEAASAIHDDESIPTALPNLAALLEDPAVATAHERTIRRALSAALRLRTADHAGNVARFATLDDAPEALRLQALAILQQWPQPANLDTVEGRFRPLEPIDPSLLAASVAPFLRTLSQSSDFAIAEAAWTVSAVYNLSPSPEDLLVIIERDTPIAAAALPQFVKSNHAQIASVLGRALTSQHATVRSQALRAFAQTDSSRFLPLALNFMNTNAVTESRAAIEMLPSIPAPAAARLTEAAVDLLLSGELKSDLTLDVLLAAEASSDAKIKQKIAIYRNAKDSTDPLSPYLETLHGGDANRGQLVFETSVAAQCTLCHRIGRSGSNVGPRLNKIGEQSPVYLLESLVNPGAVVADGYGITSATLKDGSVVAGTLLKETDSKTTIKLADGTKQVIPRNQIASRTPALSAMPPMGAMISKLELRDLLAYLQTLR